MEEALEVAEWWLSMEEEEEEEDDDDADSGDSDSESEEDDEEEEGPARPPEEAFTGTSSEVLTTDG